tara:strand:+ start:232 stop:519 length:288 start_codon:yes stop_codon:yes gene_type:complete
VINKSDLLNQLSDSFPNFYRRDLDKLINITLENIRNSLRKGYRVELRDIFILEAKKYKAKYARNPKTNEKVYVPEKKIVKFKSSSKWAKLINNEE